MKTYFVNSIDFMYNNDKIPLGLMSLVASLEKSGFESEIIDFDYLIDSKNLTLKNNLKDNIDMMVDYLLSKNPKIVSLYTMCNSYPVMIELAREIKNRKNNIYILMGGPQASMTAIETLKKFNFIDIIGIGEGEKTIVDLIEALLSAKPISNVKGIAYRDGEKIIKNQPPELMDNLDNLPFLDYNKLSNDIKKKSILIEVGRGCPFNCSFCSTSIFWKRKYRLKSDERIIEEVKFYKDKYNIDSFSFNHDMFTLNKDRIIGFCKKLINLNNNIEWACSARIDTLDEELISYLSESGCKEIYLGIESGSPNMQKIIHKNLNLNRALEKIKLLKENSIVPTVSFIYGFHEETIDDLRKTMKLIYKLLIHGIYNIQLHKLTITPETGEFYKTKDLLYFNENNSDISSTHFLDELEDTIRSSKNIFSNFYDFKTDIRTDYNELSIFIRFLTAIISKFKNTIFHLFEFYDHDLIAMYNEHKNIIKSLDKEIKNNIEIGFNNYNYLMKIFVKYINLILIQSEIFVEKPKLKTLFELENDIYSFIYFNNEGEKIQNYNLNVFKLIKNINYKDKSDTPIKVKFIRLSDHKVRVKRLA